MKKLITVVALGVFVSTSLGCDNRKGRSDTGNQTRESIIPANTPILENNDTRVATTPTAEMGTGSTGSGSQ